MAILRNFAPAIAWGIFIFIICILPGEDIPKIPNFWDLISVDKLVHMLIYLILTALILRGWLSYKKNNISKKQFIIIGCAIVLGTSGFGWFIEWFQKNYCTDRQFEILDGVANSMGSLLAFLYFLISKPQNNAA